MLDSYKMMVIYSSESIFWSALSNALILSVLYFLPYQQETWGKYISETAFRAFVLLYGFFLGIHYIRKWVNQPKNLLLESCRKGCLKGVKEALSSGSCVNQCDEAEGGMTPLMLAVGAKNIQIVDYLLKRSAIDVKRKDKDGWTALHMACVLGNSSAVLRLAKHYASIGETMEEESDIAKITPLMWCVRLGHMECFKELVAFPWVNLDTKDIYGQTLEDVAREKDNTEILRLLSEIKGRQRGQVFYAQRRIKSEKQREQIRLAEKKKFDRSLIDKAKQELRNFLGQNVNEGAEVVVEPVVTNNTTNNNNNRPEGAEGLQPGEGEDRRREVQARLDQLVEENKTERKKEQERRNQAARGSQDGASGTSEFYKSMSIVEARKELERMEKENKEKQESSKRKEEERRKKEKKEKEELEEKERAIREKAEREKRRKSLSAATNKQVDDLRSKIEKLQAQMAKEKSKIEEVTGLKAKDISVVTMSITEAEDKNDSRAKQVARLDLEIKELEGDLARLKSEKQKITNETTRDVEQIEKLTKKRLKLEKSIDAEMKRYLESDAKMKKELEHLEAKVDAIESVANSSSDGQSPNSAMVDFIMASIESKEKDLECPVCLETAVAPIFSCPESHVICSTCRPKVSKCPECRVTYKGPPRRHRFAEKTAGELEALRQQLLIVSN